MSLHHGSENNLVLESFSSSVLCLWVLLFQMPHRNEEEMQRWWTTGLRPLDYHAASLPVTKQCRKSSLLSGVCLQCDTNKSIFIFRLFFFPLPIHPFFNFCSYLAHKTYTDPCLRLCSEGPILRWDFPLVLHRYVLLPSPELKSIFYRFIIFQFHSSPSVDYITCVLSNSFPWKFEDILLYFMASISCLKITAILMHYIHSKLISLPESLQDHFIIILKYYRHEHNPCIHTVRKLKESSRIFYYYYKKCT